MKKTLSLLLFFSAILASNAEKYQYASHVRLIAQKTILEMCRKHKFLQPFGIGGGNMDQVEFISISFSCNGKLTEDKMRSIIVEGTLNLQNKINEEKELRPYLSHYPYTSKGIEVAIFTYPKEKKPGELSYAGLTRGEISYFNGKNHPNNIILEELFEEALTKVDVEQIMQKKDPSSMFTRLKTLFLK